jgi:hypothetical protein
MHFQFAMLVALMSTIGSAAAAAVPVSAGALTGSWECGPTVMKGPQFVMSVLSVTTRSADGTFVSTSTSTITPDGQTPKTLIDASRGTWKLEGTTLISTYLESRFVPSADRSVPAEIGQRVLDDELRKKSVFKSKVLDITSTSMRSIPVDSAYVEAVVESTCRRGKMSEAGRV